MNTYLQNKYTRWYRAITHRAQQRSIETYSEQHHILPRSLGGTDSADNLVYLTAREHFICHWLLTKMYSGSARHSMLNALRMMRAQNPHQQRYSSAITSRVYARLKQEYAELQSKKVSGEGNPMYGDRFYRSPEGRLSQRQAVLGERNGSKRPEVRQKISQSMTGRKRDPFGDEWIAKLSKAKQGSGNNMFGKAHKESSKQLMRKKAIGRKQSADTIKKKADAVRGSKREKKLCPHCQQMIAVNGYARWHGDNCRSQ